MAATADAAEDAPPPPESPFDKLPDELAVRIFSYLDRIEVTDRLSRACARFARLALDPALWPTLIVGLEVDANAEDVIRRCTMLRHLTLLQRTDAAHLTRVAIDSSPTCLRQVDINYCESFSADFLKNVGESASIRNLQLTGFKSSDGGDLFVSNARHLTSLTNLSLFNCRCLTSAGLRAIADHCRNLRHLNLEEVTHLDEESTNHLINTIGDQLISLFLDGEGLDDGCFVHLGRCCQLEKFGVTFAEDLGSKGLQAISTLSRLTFLKLRRGKSLSGDDFVKAFSNKKLCNLVRLDLSECCGLDDAGLVAVADNCRQLRFISLNWCWDLSDDGVAPLIKSCSKLENVELLGIVELTSAALENLPKSLPSLIKLDLEQCPKIDDAGLVALVTEMPKLHLYNYYGEEIKPPGAVSESDPEDDEETAEEDLQVQDLPDCDGDT